LQLLNGSVLENKSSVTSPTTTQPASKSKNESSGIRFFIDSTCKKTFDERKEAILAALSHLPAQVSYVNDDDYDRRSPIIPASNGSLACIRNGILVSLTLSVDPGDVDWKMLKRRLAYLTEADPEQIDISVEKKHSSWVLLRLPAEACFELLSVNKNSTKRKQLISVVVSSLLQPMSTNLDSVSVHIQVSALPMYRIFFPPNTNIQEKITTYSSITITATIALCSVIVSILVTSFATGYKLNKSQARFKGMFL
jgi:hypothetical protein